MQVPAPSTHRAQLDNRLVAAAQTITKDVQHADCGTTKREGVLGAGGRFANGEHARDGVELVGHGDNASGDTFGQLVSGKTRTVMIANRSGDSRLLTRGGGVVPAHHALLARELDNSRGDQVGFSEMSGTLGIGGGMRAKCASLAMASARSSIRSDFCRTVPSFFWKPTFCQASTELLKIDFEVLVVEELCIVQTGAHHTLVAVDNRFTHGRIGIRDDHKSAGELTLRIVGGEITLVGEHRLADDLGGHGEELLVEMANQNRGPLAEVHNLIEDFRGRVHTHAELVLDTSDTSADDLLTALGREHMRRFENLLVGRGAGNNVLTRRQNAMTARGGAALHVGKGDGYDLLSEQAADPTHRTHERGMLAPPPLATVVRPLNGRDEILAHAGKNRNSGLGRRVLLSEDVLGAVCVLAADELRGGHAILAGKTLGRLGGVSLGVECDLCGRPAENGVNLLRRLGDV